jgi:hypothetical protein
VRPPLPLPCPSGHALPACLVVQPACLPAVLFACLFPKSIQLTAHCDWHPSCSCLPPLTCLPACPPAPPPDPAACRQPATVPRHRGGGHTRLAGPASESAPGGQPLPQRQAWHRCGWRLTACSAGCQLALFGSAVAVSAGAGGLSVDASAPVLNSAPGPLPYGALYYTCRQVADGAQGGAAVLAPAWRRRRRRRRDWCCCWGCCAPAGADIDQLHEPQRPLAGGHRVPSCSGILVEGVTRSGGGDGSDMSKNK